MSIKLVLLKSGEEIIADVSTAVDKTAGTWYYQLDRPYIVTVLENSNEVQISTEVSKIGTPVRFDPWIPLTNDDKILMNHDWVVTIVNPVSDILDSYLKNRRLSNDGNGDGNSGLSSEEQ